MMLGADIEPCHACAAAELANMFAYYRQFPYYDSLRGMEQRIYKGPTFAEWAQQNSDALKRKLEG